MVLASLLLPPRCAGCDTVGPSPCAACVSRLRPLGDIDLGGALSRCLVLCDYDTTARDLVAGFKYRGSRSSLGWFVGALAERVEHAGEHVGLVTWAPASRARRRVRGFDQSAALARPLARRLGVRAVATTDRVDRHGQTGRGRVQRLDGPTLRPRPECALVAGLSVLIVDDVVTTGATMRAAAHLIGEQGARRVLGVALAHRR